ncbi:putative ribonuclease H protein [Glycine soja]
MSWVNLITVMPQNHRDHFLQHGMEVADGVRSKTWKCWWIALTWTIWHHRNKVVFQDTTFHGTKLLEDALFMKQRSISMAGRITLIKVVLTALPMFYLSFFRAPIAVIKRLTAIQRKFLWGGSCDGKKIAWIPWSKVCAPTAKGGLGITDIKALNYALLIKWKWLMFHQSDQLWSKILFSKYKGWRGLDQRPSKKYFSQWWSDLKSVNQHPVMVDVSKQLSWKVGRGDQALFWEDPWADGGVPFKERFLKLYQISSQRLHSVEDMGYFSKHGWEWNFSWRRNLFDSEMGVASTFLETIAAIRICGTLKDTWLWGAEPNGIFSTKSAYNLIKAEQILEDQDSGFHQLWDLKVPPKVLSFAWRLLWDRLPTKDNLSRRQIQLDNDLCPLCQTQPETASHLFFTCDKVLPLWWEFFTWVKEDTVLHNSPMANFLHTSTTAGGKNITRRRKTWWLAATKSIWQSRNDLVFHNQAFDIHKLIDNSIFLTWTWLKGWEKNFCAPFHHWSSAMSLAFV